MFAALLGCGEQGPPLGVVRGKVTFAGKPLAGARAVFTPKQGRTSVATTDQDGQYELEFTVDRKGAVVGEHSVAITWESPDGVDADKLPEGAAAPKPAIVIPPRYNMKTELTATVQPGDNTLDFALQSD